MGAVLLQICLGEHQNLLKGLLYSSLQIEVLFQCEGFFRLVLMGLPIRCAALFLPELHFGRKAGYTQVGKGILRKRNLSKKRKMIFHQLDLLVIQKSI